VPEVWNPFVGARIAERYARARPALHDRAVAAMRERLAPPRRAIDLGCGTGLSTRALASFAPAVIGVDVSLDMLASADGGGRITYVAAEIERLPFVDGSFDLATVASAIHWFGAGGIAEIARILAPGSPLVVYDVWFPAKMTGVTEFGQWLHDVSEARYPPVPKRHENSELLERSGFDPTWSAELREGVEMTRDELAAYLMTHSERISAVASGRESEEEQIAMLRAGLQPFFADLPARDLIFGIEIQAYERASDS
jgi:ubiquinone/menaquinone biosynthesis C-methylase UbiE